MARNLWGINLSYIHPRLSILHSRTHLNAMLISSTCLYRRRFRGATKRNATSPRMSQRLTEETPPFFHIPPFLPFPTVLLPGALSHFHSLLKLISLSSCFCSTFAVANSKSS